MSPLIATTLVSLSAAAAGDAGSAPTPTAAPDAVALVRDADRARGGFEEGLTWTVEIATTEDGATTTKTWLVRTRGADVLAEATAPVQSKGEVLLFNDRTLWFVKPGLKKPVSLSARQRLSGEASSGDIASANYARDYDGVVVGDERVGGEDTWRLELKAKTPSVTYDRIRYWVSKTRRLALKAEFLTVSGDCFKRATFDYGNAVDAGGRKLDLVSAMTITDAMGSGTVSVIRFGSPKFEAHASGLFNVNAVVR